MTLLSSKKMWKNDTSFWVKYFGYIFGQRKLAGERAARPTKSCLLERGAGHKPKHARKG